MSKDSQPRDGGHFDRLRCHITPQLTCERVNESGEASTPTIARQVQQSLYANHAEIAWGHREKGVKNGWRNRSEHWDGVARCADEENAQAAAAKILLKAKVLIHRKQSVKLSLRRVEQRAVVQVGPSTSVHGLNAMPGKERTEGPRQVAVEKDAHAAARPPE